jgi:hypothetical protein
MKPEEYEAAREIADSACHSESVDKAKQKQ